jgi:hypothetical protein
VNHSESRPYRIGRKDELGDTAGQEVAIFHVERLIALKVAARQMHEPDLQSSGCQLPDIACDAFGCGKPQVGCDDNV